MDWKLPFSQIPPREVPPKELLDDEKWITEHCRLLQKEISLREQIVEKIEAVSSSPTEDICEIGYFETVTFIMCCQRKIKFEFKFAHKTN